MLRGGLVFHSALGLLVSWAWVLSPCFSVDGGAAPDISIQTARGDDFVALCEGVVRSAQRPLHCPSPGVFRGQREDCRILLQRLPDLAPKERSAALKAIGITLRFTESEDHPKNVEILWQLWRKTPGDQRREIIVPLLIAMKVADIAEPGAEILQFVSKSDLSGYTEDEFRYLYLRPSLLEAALKSLDEKARAQLTSHVAESLRDDCVSPLALGNALYFARAIGVTDEDVLLMHRALNPGGGLIPRFNALQRMRIRQPCKGALRVCMLLCSSPFDRVAELARGTCTHIGGPEAIAQCDRFYLELLRTPADSLSPPDFHGVPRYIHTRRKGRDYFKREAALDLENLITRLKDAGVVFSAEEVKFLKDLPEEFHKAFAPAADGKKGDG